MCSVPWLPAGGILILPEPLGSFLPLTLLEFLVFVFIMITESLPQCPSRDVEFSSLMFCMLLILLFSFSICSLINKLKPGIIKRVNRRSTPIAGLVSDIISPVVCCSTISWASGVTEVHDGSNSLLYRMFFKDFSSPRWVSEQFCISGSCWIWFYLWAMHANTAFYLGFGLFLMVSYKCNCRICPKQQLGEINSDLPPWANDWNPAARAQEAAAAVTLTAGVTLACFLRCLLQFRFTLI